VPALLCWWQELANESLQPQPANIIFSCEHSLDVSNNISPPNGGVNAGAR
jgi:hypothetical protein